MWKFPPDFNPGAIPRSPDPRDIPFRAAGAPSVNWSEGHNVLKELGLTLPIKNQGSSGSCVGQAWAYLAEIKEFVENRSFTLLSPRDIYSRIWLPPDGGAYGYKGGSILAARGVATDAFVSSYINGNPPTEDWMRRRDDSEIVTRNARIRKASGYGHVTLTMDEIAYAIQQQQGIVLGVHGTNEGWGDGFVRPPLPAERIWGHFLVATGFGTIGGKRYIYGPNSWSDQWGENGYYFLSEDYFRQNYVFNPMVLMDLPNEYLEITRMKDLIKLADSPDQYLVESGYRYRIPDLETKVYLRDRIKIILDTPRTVTREEFDRFQDGGVFPSWPLHLKIGAIYPALRDAFEQNA